MAEAGALAWYCTAAPEGAAPLTKVRGFHQDAALKGLRWCWRNGWLRAQERLLRSLTGLKPGHYKENRPAPGVARGCKWGWRALVWALRGKICECDGIWGKGGVGIVEGTVSRGAGNGDFLQGVAAGSGAADVDEQSGPGSGREAAGADCLRRN